jgi:hypothetical protein
MKTIVVSCTGSTYRATSKDIPGESYSGRTIADAVGGFIRIFYEDLGISENELQAGVGLGYNWDDMENYELYYLIVRDKGLLSVESP